MLSDSQQCPGCGAEQMRVFYDVRRVPVFCNVLWDSHADALAVPRTSIRLGYCDRCGMIHNVDFDPSLLEYSPRYENALDHSPRFRQYVEALAADLVRRHGLHDKDIIEIGCGQGGFLALLAREGGNRGWGFDPSYDPSRAAAGVEDGVTIRPELFSQAHAHRRADLICCRQALEHIARPHEFLVGIRQAIGNRSPVVFFEVPNALYTLRDMGVWDVIYEHCSYFTTASLRRLFERAGFEPLDVREQYDGQFISIEARPASPEGVSVSAELPEDGPDAELVERFADACRDKMDQWRYRLAKMAHKGQSAVVWGAGSKGITFLNVMDVTGPPIEYAVDLNPNKHGRFLTGTGQRIVGPEFLRKYRPDAIIVMNPIYRDEIASMAQDLGVRAEILIA